jgi:hypothetical protein
MKKTWLGIFVVLFFCCGSSAISEKATFDFSARLKSQISKLKTFLNQKPEYNKQVAFFIDFRIPSNQCRFFVVDLRTDSITMKGLVAHGIGSETDVKDSLKFTNQPNSLSSSLGKYAIGDSYLGMFGKSYKLHGLDATNSNALSRHVVLHAYDDVPEKEPEGDLCLSHGCPMVSKQFFSRLEKILDASEKKILLTIYY